MCKNILLIAGGGTLGTYTAKELLEQGHKVDIICPEYKFSSNERLKFYRGYATLEFLEKHFENNQYDGIVNFIHYPDVEEYPQFHKLLIANTKHLIVLSSYRVYADLEHPVTENAPQLLDVSSDIEFLNTEKYALSKAKLERYLNNECKNQNWTIIRPVISFSKHRFDLVTHSGHDLLKKIESGETIPLPIEAKNLIAGLDWAGNSGKLIANLLFKEETFGEAYTVSSAQNLTWGEVADIYSELLDAKFSWVSIDKFREAKNDCNLYALLYDRLFDRRIDNRKILKATKLTSNDFLSVKDGLKIEFTLLNKEQNE